MPYVVTLQGFKPGAREDALPWTKALIGEAATSTGPFSTIATITLSPVDPHPPHPLDRNFTITTATLPSGFYLVSWQDAAGNTQSSPQAVPYPPPAMGNSGYCSIEQVQAKNAARPVTPSSVPNTAQVSQMILDAAAELDGILVNKGYNVPVSASYSEGFALISSLNATGAWAMMESAAPNSPNIDRAQAAWEAAKKMLADAKTVMDLPQNVERSEPRGPWVTFHPSGRVFDPMFDQRGGDGISAHGRNPQDPYFSRQQRF